VNEETFRGALRDDPADEVTWLALADFLDDDGQGQRAELLRLTRQLRSMPPRKRAGVRERVTALLEAGVRPVVVERTNSIGMRFALVPPGRFLMGGREGEDVREKNEPQHEVEITRPFWLGVFPVTQAQWKKVMRNNPSSFRRSGLRKDEVKGMDTADFPVEMVGWYDAKRFLEVLNGKAAEKKLGGGHRLPTEAEWEYACRAAGLSEEPFCLKAPSASLCSAQANFDGTQPAGGAPAGPYLGRTTKAGSYGPNPLGLYDLHGNVWEWCQDWSGGRSEDASPRADPTGPAEGSLRMARGGCWYCAGDVCRAAGRGRVTPETRNYGVGFRIALVDPPE
jgi:uncharacterized protein (TIGR02996 family)